MNQRKWGAILSYGNICATILVGLIYTPILLQFLGQSEYGLYSLIISMAGYLSVLDMGLGNTLVRYTARNRAVGSKQEEAELNGLFLLAYSIIGILTLGIGLFLCFHMESLFGTTLNSDELGRAKIMMLLLVFNLALSFPLSIFSSLLQAYEHFVFLRVTSILLMLSAPLLAFPFLYLGYGSIMLVMVSVILNLGFLLLNSWYCMKHLEIKFKLSKPKTHFLREITTYSFFIFLNAIMDKVYWGTGQLVLGIVSGTMEVAIYAIAMQFMMIYMNFSTAISGVMFPKVTVMVSQQASSNELTKLMTRIGRLQFLVVGYIFFIFFLLGKMFLCLWAGNSYLTVWPIVLLLMAVMMIPLVQNVGISILMAMNKNRCRMTVYSICAVLNLAICFPLAQQWGGMGCAIGTAIALLVSTGFFINYYYARHIHLDMCTFWKTLLPMSYGMIPCFLLGFLLAPYLEGNGHSWMRFTIYFLFATSLYGIFMYWLGLNAHEKNLCRDIWRRIKMALGGHHAH